MTKTKHASPQSGVFGRLRLALLTALIFWFFPTVSGSAHAAPAAPEAPAEISLTRPDNVVRLRDVERGALLLKTVEGGLYIEAPLVATDVEIDITGPIVRARVTQRFENTTDAWVEGVYVFPLPDNAGVDRLRLMIGDRFIEGQINERQEARRIYEEARAAGVRASIVEQERPNLFTNSVANIGPHETVIVQIEYQDVARLKDGVFSMRFPMVVGPRFNPEPTVIQSVSLDSRTGFAIADPVADRARITPPVMNPDAEPTERLRLPVSMRINLRAGFALGDITSPYHAVSVASEAGATNATIALANGPVPADRDFVLEWRAEDGASPHAAAFRETRDDGTYVLVMLTPPAELDADAPRRPRETIFVIDNSGSMAGLSMPQAKGALLTGLDRLAPQDTFNVIRFDDTYDLVFPTAVPATPENVARAKGYVSALSADGGTQMLPALQAALIDRTPNDVDRVRQVVFLTDGAIGNEAALFAAIDRGLGRSRLFTVGIGSAPNTYFMSRAARIGRGTFTHIGDISEVQAKTEQLFAALERPVMIDLDADFPAGTSSEVWPNPIPDLYAGEPVVITAKLDDLDGNLRISGTLAGVRWAADLSLAQAAEGEGVATLWARSKIASIEERRFTGANRETIDRLVLQTALDFDLVSRLTSLVAVDVAPARPAGARLTRTDVATMLPEGWDLGAVFGPDVDAFVREASLSDDVQKYLKRGADPDAPQARGPDGLPLPRGATLMEIGRAHV